MLRTDRVLPFLAGIGVTTLFVGGIALARPAVPEPDPTSVVIEQAAAGEEQVHLDPVVEGEEIAADVAAVDEVETAVLTHGPLSAIEAGRKPPAPRLKDVEVENVVEAPKVAESPKPSKPKAETQDAKHEREKGQRKHEKKDDRKHEKTKEDHGKKHHEKKKHDAWWPRVHGHVTACSGEGASASVDWDVKVQGGAGWEIVGTSASDVTTLGDGKVLRFVGSTGDYWEDHDKIRVATEVTVRNIDSGDQKGLHAEAYAHLYKAPCS